MRPSTDFDSNIAGIYILTVLTWYSPTLILRSYLCPTHVSMLLLALKIGEKVTEGSRCIWAANKNIMMAQRGALRAIALW